MDFLKRNNGVTTIMLLILLLVSIILIIQLEIKASSFQSRLDEHHKQLQVNSDVLEGLIFFDRGTAKGNIQLTEDIAYMRSDLASIKLKNNKVEIETPGEIKIGNGSDIKFGYDKKLDAIYMLHKGTKLNLGTLWKGKDEDYGLVIDTKSGNTFHVRNEGIGAWVKNEDGEYSLKLSSKKKFVELKKGDSKVRFEGDSINIEAKGNINIKVTDDTRFGYDKKRDILYMINKGSKFNIGTLWKGQEEDYGVAIETKSGTILHIRDEGAGIWVKGDDGEYSLKLTSKKKYVELKKGNSKVRFEGNNINIEAEGDINITSKNGKVNINGKR